MIKTQEPYKFMYSPKKNANNLQERFIMVLFVTITFNFIQIIMSYISGSLPLVNYAFHQFIDATRIIRRIFALKFANKRPNSKFTSGYHKFEIKGAILCNMILIDIITFLIFETKYAYP